MSTNAATLMALLGLNGPPLLPQIGAAAPAVKQPASGELAQARAATQTPSVLPKVGATTAEPEYLSPDAAMGGAAALLPAVGGAPPQVTNPLRQARIAAQDRVDNDLMPRTPFHDLSGWGKVGRVLGTIGDAAGTAFAPTITAMIPGSALNRAMTLRGDERALAGLTGLEDKAETQARGEEEVGLRRQQLGEEQAARQQEMTLAEQRANAPDWQHLVTDQGMFRYDAKSGKLEPLTYNGKALMGATAQKEQTPQQAAFDAYVAGGMTPEQAYEKIREKAPGTGAGGGSEKNLWSVPQPDGSHKVVALRAGDTIPNGAVSLAGYSTQSSKEGTADAPTTSALKFANDYLASGKYTGPSDEALQDQFFQMAKPSTGFRMNQAQISQLHNMASWMNSAEGMAYHASTGTWFAPEQRKEIVQTMNDLAKSKGINTASGAAPKEGDMKTNGAGDKVKFTGGKWVVQ